ncbi:MAG: hypothetical protein QNJ41_03075 [Xenococcaceae cyanobacterium MO_188.B32]|nr:hypothetical protein [Xenococcaceae cyanobacterium MO_188.B32]
MFNESHSKLPERFEEISLSTDGTSNAVSVEVEKREDSVQISTETAMVELLFKPYRLRLHNLSSGKTIVREQPGGLFYEREGITYGVKEVTDVTELTGL